MTAALKVVVPVEVTANAPNLPLVAPPIMPVKPMSPEPDVIFKPYTWLAALFNVLEKETAPLETLLSILTALFSVTGPVNDTDPDPEAPFPW